MYRSLLSILFTLAIATGLSAQQSSSTKGQSSNGENKTLTGCLSGPNDEGAYVLKTGRKSVEVGGTDDLKAHVGHQVKLSGTWARSGSEIGEREENESAEHNHKAQAREAGEKHEKSEASERHFKVTGVTMVSETCTAAKK